MENLNRDPYRQVPHQGKFFTEGGKTFYWNFSNAKPGTRHKSKQQAWRATGMPVVQMEAELSEHPMFPGAAPVFQGLISSPGFYFEVDSDVTAVENAVTPDGVITKWRVNNALSGAMQTMIAWSSNSADEYKAAKAAAQISAN
jgi:hypothetical protein